MESEAKRAEHEAAQLGKRLRGAPHWPAALALLGTGILYLFLPRQLRVGPSWLLIVVEAALLAPAAVARQQGRHEITHWLGRVLTALVTLALASSAIFLTTRLPGSKTPGRTLLVNSALVYATNILVFALWYWQIDNGGPKRRHVGSYTSMDFAFPQFQIEPVQREWLPDFIDYLFLAFNTSTAFSPTDTMVMSRRAKVLMMAQSVISLIAISVLAARAINIL